MIRGFKKEKKTINHDGNYCFHKWKSLFANLSVLSKNESKL